MLFYCYYAETHLFIYYYQLNLFLKMIIEKTATYLNKDNFLSNNHILTKSFADSQFA